MSNFGITELLANDPIGNIKVSVLRLSPIYTVLYYVSVTMYFSRSAGSIVEYQSVQKKSV